MSHDFGMLPAPWPKVPSAKNEIIKLLEELESLAQIQITPEMIKAGAMALRASDKCFSSWEATARNVFEAMLKASDLHKVTLADEKETR